MQYCLLCLNLPQLQPASIKPQHCIQLVCRKVVYVNHVLCHLGSSCSKPNDSKQADAPQAHWSPVSHAYHELCRPMIVGREFCAHNGLMHTVLLDLRLWPRHLCLSGACFCAPSGLPVPVLPSPLIFYIAQAHSWALLDNTYSRHAEYCKCAYEAHGWALYLGLCIKTTATAQLLSISM